MCQLTQLPIKTIANQATASWDNFVSEQLSLRQLANNKITVGSCLDGNYPDTSLN